MKKLIMALMAALMLAACSSDPVYHGMTPQQKQDYGQALAGEYHGRYVIAYPSPDGDWYDEVEVEATLMAVSDWEAHTVVFHDFPLSLLSRAVQDSALAQALAALPNQGLTATYQFYDYKEDGEVSWGYEPAPIPLTLEYGGETHHLQLKVSNGSMYYVLEKASLDAGRPFGHQRMFNFSFTGLYEGDSLLCTFNDFYGTYELFTYFQMDEK